MPPNVAAFHRESGLEVEDRPHESGIRELAQNVRRVALALAIEALLTSACAWTGLPEETGSANGHSRNLRRLRPTTSKGERNQE